MFPFSDSFLCLGYTPQSQPLSQSQPSDECKKKLATIPSTHSPVSRSEVLQCPCSCLQGVVVVTAGEKREVEPHHLWLVQQLQAFNRKAEKVKDDIQAVEKCLHDHQRLKTSMMVLLSVSVSNANISTLVHNFFYLG